MIEFLKKVFKDPLSFAPSKDSVAKSLNGIEFSKLLLVFVSIVSSGFSIDKIAEIVANHQTDFGAYGAFVVAVVAVVVQAKKMWNQEEKKE